MNDPSGEPTFPLQGFTIDRGHHRASASVDLDARHLNPNGVSHGAVAFTLMDTAMGAAAMTAIDDGNACATIELHTRFHRGPTRGRLSAGATVLTAGRRVIHLEAKTYDETGRIVASATASFAVISPAT